MPHRSLSGDFTGSVEAPPSYDHILSQQEFEQKAANVAEQTASEAWNVSGPADTGKKRRTDYDEFEDWDDAKFEAAAAAYRARLARQAASSGGAGSSSSAPTSSTSSSSAYRSQSPARQPPSQQWALPAVPAAPQTAMQLPPPSNTSTAGQRSLPPRPGEQVYGPGPSSPPYLPAFTSPRQFPDEKTAMPWMKSGMSDDEYGRASIESLPPFAPIASPTSEYSDSPFAQPQQQSSRQSAMSNPPPQSAPAAMYNVPPPPHTNAPIPQAPATAPLLPTSSSSSSQPPIPPVTHRHSDIPSSMATPRPPMAPQRRSDIPNANPQPPNFVGSRPFNLPQEKKSLYGQPSSAASALYASAKTKSSMPLVRPDFGTLAYQTHTPSTTNEESHMQPSLYSSAVSSVLKKPTLPPVPKQTMSSGSQYSQPYQQPPQQSYQQGYQTQGNLYGPYVSQSSQPPASTFYGQPTQNYNQGFYGQSQPVYSQYQPQVRQQQPVPPQGYPPTATQNNWAPAPDSWQQNYGRY